MLHDLRVLDAPADPELDALVRVAAAVAGVPTASANLLDAERQCQVATTGFVGADSPLATSMCAVSARTGGFVLVPDAREDPRFAASPWVDGQRGRVRFYAAAPLVTSQGHVIGTLCVFDTVVRTLTEEQVDRLTDIAAVLVVLLERHRRAHHEQHLTAAADEARSLLEMAHEEMAVRHELLEAVLDTVEVGIAAVDAAGELTVLNSSAQRWLGLPVGATAEAVVDAVRTGLFEADGRTPLSAARSPLRRALHEGAVEDAEVVIASPGHAPLRTVVRARALSGADGQVDGAVMSMMDVTAERATAAELQRSNAELQQFAAIASHDLRSPLTVVDGYVELVGDVYGERLGERGRAWLATARGGVRRMGALIDALLSYAQAGAQVLVPEPVDVQELLDLVLLDLRSSIAREDASVVVVGELPTVWGDPVQLRQLLQNLLANALKFTRPGAGASIRCSALARGGEWLLSVADDGVGIPPERREAVFRMFERSGARAQTDGHGIGLATAERIVTRHGGRIWVEETPGGGATVCFTVPREAPEDAPAAGCATTSGPVGALTR